MTSYFQAVMIPAKRTVASTYRAFSSKKPPLPADPRHFSDLGKILSRYSAILAWCLLVTMWALPKISWGQGATATITGTITDTSDYVISGATVTITEKRTGVSHQFRTSNAGSYQAPFLPVGIYDVSVQKDGFQSETRTQLTLNVADVTRSDFKLKIGQSSESVIVQADALTLNTENAEVSTTVTGRQVQDLPLNGRNFTELMLLDSSAVQTFGSDIGGFLPGQGGQIAVGGSRVSSNGYTIDGLDNRDVLFGAPLLLPSIDSIDQFKDQNKTFSAEYGGSANEVNISLKSGTNSLHGTVYDYLRNTVLDARTWGINGTNTPTPRDDLKQNQFGYSLGGPVFIPKLYNGRDKTFFFASYEGFRHIGSGSPIFLQVPNASEMSGVCDNPCHDPLTGQPFPNNTIPSSRFSAFANGVKPFLYAPNFTPVSSHGLANFVTTFKTPFNTDQQNYKIDEHITGKDTVSVRYSNSSQNIASLPNGANGTQAAGVNTGLVSTNVLTTMYQGAYTRVLTPNIVNYITVGHIDNSFGTTAPTISTAEAGAIGINGGYPGQKEIPTVSFLNGVGASASGSASTTLNGLGVNSNYPLTSHQTYWNFIETLQVVRGKHAISLGGSLLQWHAYNGSGPNYGTWAFNGSASGDPFGDFLLGDVYQISSLGVPSPFAPTAASVKFDNPQHMLGFYASDQWKATPRLSLNMGLRYEFISIPVEAQNRFGWINPKYPGGGLCTSNKRAPSLVGNDGALQYCGASPNPASKLSFGPRFGFAYLLTPNGSTVLRGGAGVYFDGPEEQDQPNAGRFYPFDALQNLTSKPGSQLTTSMPVPEISTFRPINLLTDAPAFPAANPRQNPYYTEWTLGIERKLPFQTNLSLIYTGNEGTHEQARVNVNMAKEPADPSNPTPLQSRRQYPNMQDLWPEIYALSSNYHAGTVRVEHQAANLILTAAYTYSKSMDVKSASFGVGNEIGGWASPMNYYNLRADYGPSAYNLTHRAVVSFVYPLPIGRGKALASNVNRVTNALIGGWQVNGILTFQSGPPFSISTGYDGPLNNFWQMRANQASTPKAGFRKGLNEWFNTSAFVANDIGRYGNSSKGVLTAPGTENWDTSLLKDFPISEKVSFQLRGEFFNSLNHANYYGPNSGCNPLPAVNGVRACQPSVGFGSITGASPGRIGQVAAKIIF